MDKHEKVLDLLAVVAEGVDRNTTSSGARLAAAIVYKNRVISVGINQKRVDTYTFALGCGLAGIAGSSFTMLASTAPDTGQAYIVDTFIVVVFGGVESLLGTVFAAFLIGQFQGLSEYFLSGSMARALILLMVIVVLFFRPNGLFATRVRR